MSNSSHFFEWAITNLTVPFLIVFKFWLRKAMGMDNIRKLGTLSYRLTNFHILYTPVAVETSLTRLRYKNLRIWSACWRYVFASFQTKLRLLNQFNKKYCIPYWFIVLWHLFVNDLLSCKDQGFKTPEWWAKTLNSCAMLILKLPFCMSVNNLICFSHWSYDFLRILRKNVLFNTEICNQLHNNSISNAKTSYLTRNTISEAKTCYSPRKTCYRTQNVLSDAKTC